ncbi:MAG: ABC-2 transporter permease [Lachnospiraceae bacterium]
MKGLLIKDFKLIFSNVRMLIAFIFISFFLLFSSNSAERYSFVISYLTIISFMFVLSSISYDDFDHGLSFLMTLPVSRKTYVREKYCFGLLCGLAGWIFALILCLIFSIFGNAVPLSPDFMLTSAAIFLVLLFTLALTIPIQLKFGGDNGKIFIILLIGALFVVGFAISKIAQKLHIDLESWFNKLFSMGAVPSTLMIAVLALIALAVSYLISVKIMRNKQL